SIRGIFKDHESLLFKDRMAPQLDGLRETAGQGMGRIVLEHAIEAAERGKTGNDGLEEAMTNALTDRAARGNRQVEEHYCRKSTAPRAQKVRERIEEGIRTAPIKDGAADSKTRSPAIFFSKAEKQGLGRRSENLMPEIKPTSMTLPSISIAVVEKGGRSRKGWLRCEEGENITFSTAHLETYCLAQWEPIIYDALLLAAAVEIADRTLHRPALRWEREMEICLPVHD